MKIRIGDKQIELTEGLHYGRIPMGGGRMTDKPSLLKAGAEKIMRETGTPYPEMKMLTGAPNFVIWTTDGIGAGAGSLTEKRMHDNLNTALKMAKKRAVVDFVLSRFYLSEWFTQDLEDMEVVKEDVPPSTRRLGKPKPIDPALLPDDRLSAAKKLFWGQCKLEGIDEARAKKHYLLTAQKAIQKDVPETDHEKILVASLLEVEMETGLIERLAGKSQ